MTASIKSRTPDQPAFEVANNSPAAMDHGVSWPTGSTLDTHHQETRPLPAADGDDSGPGAPARKGLIRPLLAADLPHHRAIVALDIERSTSRPDPVKAELRNKTYELFDAALHSAGIRKRHRDRYIDRGDGLLALIHPVDQAPKALLLNRVIPALSSLLADYNASLPHPSRLQRQLRVRVVTHAGDVRYDANGCFGEALDVAFRLLDAVPVKRALRETTDPLILVISGDIYSSVVRHGHDGIDQHAFHPLVRIQIAGKRYPGWIHIPGTNDAAGHADCQLPAPRATADTIQPDSRTASVPDRSSYRSIPVRVRAQNSRIRKSASPIKSRVEGAHNSGSARGYQGLSVSLAAWRSGLRPGRMPAPGRSRRPVTSTPRGRCLTGREGYRVRARVAVSMRPPRSSGLASR